MEGVRLPGESISASAGRSSSKASSGPSAPAAVAALTAIATSISGPEARSRSPSKAVANLAAASDMA